MICAPAEARPTFRTGNRESGRASSDVRTVQMITRASTNSGVCAEGSSRGGTVAHARLFRGKEFFAFAGAGSSTLS
jgi:hypothetical protein